MSALRGKIEPLGYAGARSAAPQAFQGRIEPLGLGDPAPRVTGSPSVLGFANDTIVTGVNSALGIGKAVSDFVSVDNPVSRGIQWLIDEGEATYTPQTRQAREDLFRAIDEGGMDAARGVGEFLLTSPVQAAAMAAGNFGPFGAFIKGARGIAAARGASAAGQRTAGIAAASGLGGAAAGGDAAGDAYEQVMRSPNVDPAVREELARQAAREASVVPAIIGAATPFLPGSAESQLARGLGLTRASIPRAAASEFGQEFIEEGATKLSANLAARQYDETIDPSRGVFGSALLGGALGAGTGAGITFLNNRAVAADLLRRDEAIQAAERAPYSELPANFFDRIDTDNEVGLGIVRPINPYDAAGYVSAFQEGQDTELGSPQAGLFGNAGGLEQEVEVLAPPTPPTPAAPASKVFSAEEQELIDMGVAPNGNALKLLSEIKASGLPMDTLAPVVTAMAERKNAQAKKLLAQAIIESRRSTAAAGVAPTAAPVGSTTAPVGSTTAPVAEAPGVTSLPVPEVTPGVQAEDVAPTTEAEAEALQAALTQPQAAQAAPTEPVVQRKRRVVNPAALAQSQAFVAPELVAEEEASADPTDEAAWEDSKPDGAPALEALTPALRQAWAEARAAKTQGRSINLYKVAEDIVAEQGDTTESDDDTLATLNQIFGERDAAMLYDRYVGDMTEEAIANKYGQSRQNVAKVTGEGELGRKTRAAKIAAAQKKFGWTDEYVSQLAARLSPAQTVEVDATSGKTAEAVGADLSAFGGQDALAGDEFSAYSSVETSSRDPSLREAGFSTSASLGGSVSNWRDSGELAGRQNISQADQAKLDDLYAKRAVAEEKGQDKEVADADAAISMIEAKYLTPGEVAAKFTQAAMDLQDRIAKRTEQIEQALAAGRTEVSINNKLVPVAELEAEIETLQTRIQEQLEKAEAVLQRGAVRKAKGAEQPKAAKGKVRVVKKAQAATPKTEAAAPASAAPTEVLTTTEQAAKAWDQAAKTIPGAPQWAELPAATQNEFKGYGENNWTRQDVVALMQRSSAPTITLDATANDTRKLKKGQKVSIETGRLRFTGSVTDLASLERFPGVARALATLRSRGLGGLLDDVTTFIVTDESVDFDGALMPGKGGLTLAIRGGALPSSGTAEWTIYHEFGHVADGVQLGGGAYSGAPGFNVRVVNGKVIPMGALMREAFDAFQNDPTSELGQRLAYPLDFSRYGALAADRLREEVFAQLWAMHLDRDGRDYLEDNHPALADFMESVHDAIRAERSQAGSAGAAQTGAGTPAQEQAVGQEAARDRGAQGVDGQGARLLKRPALPAELQKPVGVITNTLRDVGNAALNTLTFTEDVINRAVDLGIKSAGRLRSIYQERAALTGKLEREVERVADLYNRVPESERGTGPRSVNQFLYDATREGKWGFKPDWRKGPSAAVTLDPEMLRRYGALSKESKELVRSIFQHGDEVLSLKKQTVIDSTNSEYDALIAAASKAGDKNKVARLTTDKAEQLKRFDSLFALQEFRPYAPLRRFGNYVVIARSQKYLDADETQQQQLEKSEDHYHVSFAESAAAARELVEQLQKQGAFAEVEFFQKEDSGQTMFGGMLSAFNKLRSELDSELAKAEPGEKNALRAARKVVGELYLSTLAENSARKSEMRRRGVAGEIDVLRSFTTQGRADAQFIAGAKYNGQTLDVFNAMRKEVKESNADAPSEARNTKSGVLNELLKRHTQSMDYDPTPIASKLARLTSIWFLATSPAYYLQNLTQPFMMSLPFMAGQHNYLKATNALLKAYTDLAPMFRTAKLGEQFNFDAAPQDVRAAISTLVDRGRIDIGMDTDLGRFQIEGQGQFKDRWNKIDRGIYRAAQKLEAVNRLSTAIAAYRMELAKTGNTAQALEYADNVISQTHGDYTANNAPRAFNTPTGKVALQFRKFQLIQLTLLAKLVRNSFPGKQDAAVARKTLAFTLGHTAVMAGAIGLPGFAAISWLLGALGFGDDEEPFNAEKELREFIGNDQLATLITRGVPAALGVDLSNKLGMGNVLSILPFNELDLSSRSGLESAAFSIFGGPAGALTLRAADGINLIRDGQYYKGLEQLMPTGVTNAMKSYRQATEGVTRRNGDVLISPEEISGMDTFWQAIGFQPTQLAERQFFDRVVRDTDRAFQSRADKIRSAYLRAGDDYEAKSEARDRWAELQDAREAAGYRRQPLSTLIRSESAQRERERNTLDGVQFNRNNRSFVQELIDAEE